MRILKYAFFTILALALVFFAFGLFKPSISYGHEITVDKPVKEAWAVTKDVSKYDQWLEGFKSIELIEGEQDKPGSKYKVVVDPGEGQAAFEMIQTLVAIKEFEQAQMHFDSEFMEMDQTYTHSESDGKTTITTEATVRPKGLMLRSLFAIMETFTGSFSAQEKKNIEALKRVIEENTRDYYPAPASEAIESATEGGDSE